MSDYTSWYVGMKVVCIRPRPDQAPSDAVYPEENRVYTLREIRDDRKWHGRGIVVLLAEIDNSHFIGRFEGANGYFVEPGFNPKGFRPVQPRATDISIFTAMLTGAKEREPA